MAYARIHMRGGRVFDQGWVEPSEEAEFERGWREVYARVEWLSSRKGRLDNALPQTLPRIVHNLNARSYSRLPNKRNGTPFRP